MTAFEAYFNRDTGPLPVEVEGAELRFSAREDVYVWSIHELTLEQSEAGLVLRKQEDSLHSETFQILNALLPYLHHTQRPKAMEMLAARSPRGHKGVLWVLIGTALIAGLVALGFFGQIRLRQQELSKYSTESATALAERHRSYTMKSYGRCTSPALVAPLGILQRTYQTQSGSNGLKDIWLLPSVNHESFILSDGTLLITTQMLQNLKPESFFALLGHQEGHLQKQHRAQAHVYHKGASVFDRLWRTVTSEDSYLESPLEVKYTRGQEAGADTWATARLPGAYFKALLPYLNQRAQMTGGRHSGWGIRHPLATDRLQEIDQFSGVPPALSTEVQEAWEALQRARKSCTQN